MQTNPTAAELHARIRWVRMCMALLVFQDDMRIAAEIALLRRARCCAGNRVLCNRIAGGAE